MMMNPSGISTEYQFPKALMKGVYLGCLAPMDWKEDWNPCAKCRPSKMKEII